MSEDYENDDILEVDEIDDGRTIPNEFMPTDNLRVLFIHHIGVDGEGKNVYHFLIGTNADDAWAEGWYDKPAGNIPFEEMILPREMYEYCKELHTDIKLDLAQNNGCFTMQDCRDHVIALAAENLDEAEEYPEQGRIVIQFGELLDEVETMFARRNNFLKYV